MSAFEREIGMSNGSFASQLKKNKTIGLDKLENIIKRYPDIDLNWLLTGTGYMIKLNILEENDRRFYKKLDKVEENPDLPLYDIQTTAGIIYLFGDNENQKPVEFISVPKTSNCDGALYVTGDSMHPLLKSGDIALYKKIFNLQNNIIWGEMYLIYVNNYGNESFFTRYLKQSERESYVQFVALNPDHQTIEFPVSSIKALALVKGFIRVNSLF
ncbi:S24 family peptidase [Flavobacterium sp. AC]|uniref:S24 family peptidase n=1 Tax=Flavobacterium azizsancarii TaxID=2961580 RepID=A0ABT4WDP9_9FLAO|nr:S24 family peptidase [Flavobacterium azizsancarii]